MLKTNSSIKMPVSENVSRAKRTKHLFDLSYAAFPPSSAVSIHRLSAVCNLLASETDITVKRRNRFSKLMLWSLSLGILLFVFTFKVYGSQSEDGYLRQSYDSYKQNFLSKDGRIIDPEMHNNTTSEGQSYILLRSLVMNDKKTFDLSWKWTKDNLQRKDHLFSWVWGKNQSGEYKILDYNTASDADSDIALALILAYQKWNKSNYIEQACPIIDSIWKNETRKIGDHIVLMPGVLQAYSEKIEVNPSYFMPYAYRYFQKYDELHDWNCLIDSSYYYLNEVISKTATGLPPNWFLIEGVQDVSPDSLQDEAQNRGQIVLADSERSDFSYDAVRIFARIYYDYIQNGEERALPILEKSKFFIEQWKKDKTFYVNYQANGQLRDKDKFVGSMSILIPVISMYDKKVALEMYETQVEPFWQSKKYWEGARDYYGKNLSWYGYYMYNREIK